MAARQGSDAAKLIARVGADIDPYTKKMAQADQVMKKTAKSMAGQADQMAKGLTGGLGGLAGLAGIAGLAMLSKQIVTVAFDLSDLAQQAERTFGTFNRLVGGEGVMALEALRAATMRGVDDQRLMAGASTFLAMHLAQTWKEAAHLAKVSTQLGMAMGMGPQKAMSDFALLLANMSLPRLDQFGISSGRVRARIAELQQQISGLSRETAFMTAVMEEAESTMRRVGEQKPTGMELWTAAVANFKVAVAEYLAGLADATAGGAAFINKQTELMQADVAAAKAMEPYNVIVQERIKHVGMFATENNALVLTLGAIERALSAGKMSEQEAIARARQLLGLAEEWRLGLQRMDPELRAGTELHKDLAAAIMGVSSAWRSMEMPTEAELTKFAKSQWQYAMAIRDPAQQIQLIEDAQRKLNRATAEGQTEWWNLERQRFLLQKGLNEESETEAERHLDKMKQAYDKYLTDVRATVQAGLQATQVTAFDMLATQFGDYADKPDEYIRKLQAAFERPEGEHGWMLGGRRGKEAEYYLAQQKRAFAGYDFEKMGAGFDYDAMIKALAEQVREKQAIDARLQDVTADVLAALGGAPGIGEADVLALLEPATAQGQQTAENFATGWKSEDLGQIFTDAFDEQLAAQEQRWTTFGGLIVEWMGDGMKDGLHGEFVSDLVDVLVPKVKEELTGVN